MIILYQYIKKKKKKTRFNVTTDDNMLNTINYKSFLSVLISLMESIFL